MVAGIISCRSLHPIRRRPTHATATDHAPPRGQIDPDTTLGWLRRFLPLVRAHQALFLVTLALGLASTIAMMTSPVYLQQAIDDGLINRSVPLSKFVWILSGLVTFSGITGVLNRRLMTRVSARIEYDLRAIVQQKLARQSFAFHDQTETGQLISRANSDLRVIQMFLVFGPSLATLYVGFFYALVLMLRAHVGLTLVTLSVMPAVIFVGIRMRQITFPLSHLVQARTADVTSIVEENLAGAHVVRAMSAEVDQIKRLDIASDGLRWAAEQEVIVRARYQPLMSLIPQAGTALFLLVAGWLTIA
ncbi:MAG: ATP-binding cassette subfamily B protein, partial [Glaciecola sp.]